MFRLFSSATARSSRQCVSLRFRHNALSITARSTRHHGRPRNTRDFFSTTRNEAQYVRFGSDPGRRQQTTINGWPLNHLLVTGVGVGGVVYYVTHLEQVPETGRWRFMSVSPQYETRLAQELRTELLREYRGRILPPNHPVARHIQRVVNRILESNDLGHLKGAETAHSPFLADDMSDDWFFDPATGHVKPRRKEGELSPGVGGTEWDLIVVNDDRQVNAAASYGNIIVFTGILPVCVDEQGLAAVLGHEIGHVVARHSSERYSQAKLLAMLPFLIGAFTGLDIGLSGAVAKVFMELPNSRKMEYEADKIGLHLTAKACYDPRAAPQMFKRLEAVVPTNSKFSFLSTHPANQRRIEALNGMLHEAYQIQAASPECAQMQDRYAAFNSAQTRFNIRRL